MDRSTAVPADTELLRALECLRRHCAVHQALIGRLSERVTVLQGERARTADRRAAAADRRGGMRQRLELLETIIAGALRSANHQLRMQARIVDSSPDLIAAVDRRLVYQMVNPAYARVHGRPASEIVAHTMQEVLDAETLRAIHPYLQRCLAGEQVRFEHAFRYPALGWRDVEVNYHPLGDDGGVDGVVAVIRDLSERKQGERLKNELISVVSHELRTPLTCIVGSLGLLNGRVLGEISPQIRSLVEIAYRNSERLARLVDDLLDLDRIESGNMRWNLQPVDLGTLAEQTLAANQPLAARFGVTLVLERRLPGTRVNADAGRLVQALTSLLSNAAKFSPPGSRVSVRIARVDGSVRVSVSDRGPGIPEHFRARVFQRFAQADSSDARSQGGSGLGLSIAKSIIESLGGRIGFETAAGQGSTFYFDLPEHAAA